MRYQGALLMLWLFGAFAVGTVTFSPINGAALSFGTTFFLWMILESRDITY